MLMPDTEQWHAIPLSFYTGMNFDHWPEVAHTSTVWAGILQWIRVAVPYPDLWLLAGGGLGLGGRSG